MFQRRRLIREQPCSIQTMGVWWRAPLAIGGAYATVSGGSRYWQPAPAWPHQALKHRTYQASHQLIYERSAGNQGESVCLFSREYLRIATVRTWTRTCKSNKQISLTGPESSSALKRGH